MAEKSTALQPFVPQTLAELDTFSVRLSKSELIPRTLHGRPADVAVILLTGHELGLPPMVALRSIHVIDGRPILSADLMVALCRRSPVCRFFRLVESTAQRAVFETQRQEDREPTRLSWTLDEARVAGLAGKANWKAYPAAMLRARCAAALARSVFPDVVGGIYDPDELDRGGNDERPREPVIDVTPVSEAPTATPTTPAPREPEALRLWAMRQVCTGDYGERWVGTLRAVSRESAVEAAPERWPDWCAEHWMWQALDHDKLQPGEREILERVQVGEALKLLAETRTKADAKTCAATFAELPETVREKLKRPYTEHLKRIEAGDLADPEPPPRPKCSAPTGPEYTVEDDGTVRNEEGKVWSEADQAFVDPQA